MAMAGAPRTYTSQNKCIKTTLIIILSQIVMKTLIKFTTKNSDREIIVKYMASPWDHGVYEEGENIAKYQDLKGKIGINNAELDSTGSCWCS